MLELEQWSKKTLTVEAVRITEENIGNVARWINPNSHILGSSGNNYILVPWKDARGHLQKTPTYVGSWVTLVGDDQFKSYSDKKFRMLFEKNTRKLSYDGAFVWMVGGERAPLKCIDALDKLDEEWSDSTFGPARAKIAYEVLKAVGYYYEGGKL